MAAKARPSRKGDVDAVPVAHYRSFRGAEASRDDQIRAELLAARLPRTLALSSALLPLERALDACSALRSRLGNVPFQNNMIRVESKLDALALDGGADRSDALLRLMLAQAVGERPAPRELRLAAHALEAFRHGLAAVRAGGRAALTMSLLGELARLGRGTQPAFGPVAVPSAHAPAGAHPGTQPGARIALAYPLATPDDALTQATQDLERFLTDPPPLPLPVRMAMAAARIELLAPFEEASPQLARLLMPLMAAADGRPPLFIAQVLAARRDAHQAALAEFEAGQDWEVWIGRYLGWLADAADAAAIRLERAERLRLDREAGMDSLRSDSTARRLAELAFGMPVLTVCDAQEMLEVSFQTANAAVATLVRLGILAPHSNIRRNRIFIFGQTLDMLAESLGPAPIT